MSDIRELSTWKCHVCGRSRRDAFIGVFTSTWMALDTRIEIDQNVRYCRDNQECIDGAKTMSFLPEGKYVQLTEGVKHGDA